MLQSDIRYSLEKLQKGQEVTSNILYIWEIQALILSLQSLQYLHGTYTTSAWQLQAHRAQATVYEDNFLNSQRTREALWMSRIQHSQAYLSCLISHLQQMQGILWVPRNGKRGTLLSQPVMLLLWAIWNCQFHKNMNLNNCNLCRAILWISVAFKVPNTLLNRTIILACAMVWSKVKSMHTRPDSKHDIRTNGKKWEADHLTRFQIKMHGMHAIPPNNLPHPAKRSHTSAKLNRLHQEIHWIVPDPACLEELPNVRNTHLLRPQQAQWHLCSAEPEQQRPVRFELQYGAACP